jgi:hypothetical protein
MAKTNSLKLVPYGTKRMWVDGGIEEHEALLEYTYGDPQYPASGVTYKDNEPFEATLKIMSLERGRSAARFWFQDVNTGTYYPFFGQTLVDMITASDLLKGVVTGTWIAVKKGQNYGIELYNA